MMASTKADRPPANLLAQIQRHSQVYTDCLFPTLAHTTDSCSKGPSITARYKQQVIVDTADYEQIEGLPLVTEATTNPSIVWGAAQQQKYFHLLEEACNVRKGNAVMRWQ